VQGGANAPFAPEPIFVLPSNSFFCYWVEEGQTKNRNILKTIIWVVNRQQEGKPLRFTGRRIEAWSILPSPTPHPRNVIWPRYAYDYIGYK
jgi:hypothetical protein